MIRLLPRAMRAPALAWGYRLGGWPRRTLVVVLVIAGGATALADARPATNAAEHQVSVLVAARAIPAGARLSPADLRVTRWPPALAPPGALGQTAAATDRYVAGPIGVGEAITRTRLRGAELTDGLPSGTVAVSIALASSAAGGFIHAGDRVDLVRTPTDSGPVTQSEPSTPPPSSSGSAPPGSGSSGPASAGAGTAGSSASGSSSPGSAAVVARNVPVLDVASDQDVVSLLVAVTAAEALAIADQTGPFVATLRPPS